MSTEFYTRGGVTKGAQPSPYDPLKYLGARVGLGSYRTGFSWNVHPEDGMRHVVRAGGATDAYGVEFTPAEFQAMLRDCEQQDWMKCEISGHAKG